MPFRYRLAAVLILVLVLIGSSTSPIRGQASTQGFVVFNHRTCENVQQQSPYDCVGPTTAFSISDAQVVSWIVFDGVHAQHEISWQWVEPSNVTYDTFSGTFGNNGLGWYVQWSQVSIQSMTKNVAHPLGSWMVRIYVDEEYLLADFFTISPSNNYVSNSSALSTISPFSMDVTCSNKPLNISTSPNAWDPAFFDAKKVNLITDPRVPGYKYAWSSDNAAVRITCDPNKYYFLGEYVIPGSGSVVYKSADLQIYIDTKNSKSSAPQLSDYFIDLALNVPSHHGWVWMDQGSGVNGNLGWSNNFGWLGNHADASSLIKISDPAFAMGDYSVMSTSIFKQPHPVGFLEISKSYPQNSLNLRSPFDMQNPFGLGLEILDSNHVVQGANWVAYYALFPSYFYWYKPSTWGDIYSSYQSQITTSQLITTTPSTQTSIISQQTSQLSSTNPPVEGFNAVEITAGVVLAAILVIAGAAYKRRIR